MSMALYDDERIYDDTWTYDEAELEATLETVWYVMPRPATWTAQPRSTSWYALPRPATFTAIA